MINLTLDYVKIAHNRIKDHIIQTPIITNKSLNDEIGANIFFKLENLQKTGSFKIRGATNNILGFYQKNGKFPDQITTASSGNHAIAIAQLSQKFNIKDSVIFIDQEAAKIKIEESQKYQSQIIITKSKMESNILVDQKIAEGYYMCSSYGDDDIILGQATATFEAMNQIDKKIDAIFAPCGGGGLISGAYIVANGFDYNPKVFAVEPVNANDAQLSVKNNEIFKFHDTPKTIADGARTLWISEKTFPYIKKLNDIYTANDDEIIFWHKKLTKLLDMNIEPTAILALIGAKKFIDQGNKGQNILIILSGGNSNF
ncbi:pyridoxal-phosphate dependent enzyme [Rickettsiales bacterium]|nr:pyridoxal-phosphate dependent enzyme [Rickettsiales bacterium]